MYNRREMELMGDNTAGSALAASMEAGYLDQGAQVIGDDGRPPVRIELRNVNEGFVDPRDAWRENAAAAAEAARAEAERIPPVTFTRSKIVTDEPDEPDYGYGS